MKKIAAGVLFLAFTSGYAFAGVDVNVNVGVPQPPRVVVGVPAPPVTVVEKERVVVVKEKKDNGRHLGHKKHKKHGKKD